MATKVLTTLQDDIDGSNAVETVRFGLDGVEWEIDLSERRKVGGHRRRKAANSTTEFDPKAVRKWAEANGIEVNSRGRIPAELVDRYKSAGN
jgi:hypothetical protein